MFDRPKKCEAKDCTNPAKWFLSLERYPKVVEFNLCPECATKVTKFLKGVKNEDI